MIHHTCSLVINIIYHFLESINSLDENIHDSNVLISHFCNVPASILCDIEFILTGNTNDGYNIMIRENSAMIYSDVIFFYFHLCFFQQSHFIDNFPKEEFLLQDILGRLNLSLSFFKRFFLSRFNSYQNSIQMINQVEYFSGND